MLRGVLKGAAGRVTDVRISYSEKCCRLRTCNMHWTNNLLGTILSTSKFHRIEFY